MQLNKLVASEKKMQSLVADALRTDLNASVRLSMRAVSSLIDSKCLHLFTGELQRQVKGIAVQIISLRSLYNLIFPVI
jgi:hypothetical protein